MGKLINEKYQRGGGFVPNFNFIDFISGKGIVEFFMGSVSGQNRLSPTAFYGDTVFKLSTETDTASFVKVLDEDFDVEFLRPVIIEGEAITTVPVGLNVAGGTSLFSFRAVVIIRHVTVGGTETNLVSTTGTTVAISHGIAGDTTFVMFSIDGLIPKQLFRIGEQLRVTVELYGKRDVTNALQLVMGVDPKGRLKNDPNVERWDNPDSEIDASGSSANFSTIASIQVPFQNNI